MKSIQTKIIALLFCGILLSSLIIGFWGVVATSKVLYKSSNEKMNLLCEVSAEKLDTIFETVEKSVNTFAQYAEDNLDSIDALEEKSYCDGYTAEIEKIAISHMNSADSALDIYVCFNPEILNENIGFFWIGDGEENKLTERPITDISFYDREGSEHDVWTCTDLESGGCIWTKPYQNENINERIVSYVVPLYKDNTMFGVAGMDISCDIIENAAKEIAVFDTGYASVLNYDGTVMYHPSYEYGATVEVEDKNFEEISATISENEKSDELISYTINSQNKHMSFCALRNGMRICISAPDTEIYRAQHVLAETIVIITLIITVTSIIIAVSVGNRIISPLKKLNHSVRQMSAGNLDVKIDVSSGGEIGELALYIDKAREKIKDQMEKLSNEAHHDGLTGVNNKTAFLDEEALLDGKIKAGDASFAVAVFDVNKLKITNDVFGHMAGDELLCTISDNLCNIFTRKCVFRIGGDEFVIIRIGEQSESFEDRVEECALQMESLSLRDFPQCRISCAWGVAFYDKEKDRSFADVLRRADKRMYKKKALTKKQTYPWQEGSKGIKQIQIEKYLEFLKILSQSTEDYLFLYHIESDRTWFFGNIKETFAIGTDESPTCSVSEIMEVFYPKDRDEFLKSFDKIKEGESDDHNMNYRWIDRLGETVWINFRGRVIKDDNGFPFVVIGRASQNVLKHLYNPLTGLFNRDKLIKDFQDESSVKYNCLMLLDIDNLSDINLKHGRICGDNLLKFIAKELENRFPMRQIYHTEQDCFAILLDAPSSDCVRQTFEGIQKALKGKCTISAAVVPNDRAMYVDENNIYEYARQILKYAQKQGAGNLSFFSKADLLHKLSEVELVEEIEESIRNDFKGFSLVFQPQVNAKDYSLSSFEALLRFNPGSNEPANTDEFIPLLERTGLINEVGFWVLSQALEKCKKWREVLPDLRICVNFSSVQLRTDDIAEKVIMLLREYGLPGSALTVEITESVQLENFDVFTLIFTKFRNAGIQVAIDDFGTGYSNLGYLKKIHADEIKVDRMFIKDIKEESYNYKLISNIIDFAKANSFRVCLEGMETVEELAVLDSLHPDVLQGYLFDKPCTVEELEKKYLRSDTKEYAERENFIKELRENKEKSNIVHFDTH
ncbi:MAG: EAL domain-containing protein, partial [Eubacteriales bacterium]